MHVVVLIKEFSRIVRSGSGSTSLEAGTAEYNINFSSKVDARCLKQNTLHFNT